MSDNTLAIFINFKAKGEEAARQASGWLTGLTNKVRQHTSAMDAFNKKVQNGEAALQKWGAIAAAAFGTQALRRYIAEAGEALRVNQQLAQTLALVGASDAKKELNAQAGVLEHTTNATAEQVTTVQRLMLANHASVAQTRLLTQAVLDFAAATGQDAVSAAQLIAREINGDTAELGRYNIALDSSKDRITALVDALSDYASGQAEAAVVDRRAHAAKVDLDNANKELGASLLALKGPLLETINPVITLAGGALKGVLDLLGPLVPSIVRTAMGFGALALAAKGLVSSMSLVKTVINPLRAGFVALTGNINDTFLATMRLNTADWGGLKNLMRAMNPGMLVSTGLSLAAAFGVGYQIGTAISDAIVAGIEARRQAIIDSVSASTQAAIAVIKQANSIRSAADAEAAAERTRQLIGIEEKTEKRLTDLSKKHIHGSDGFTGVRVRERGLDELEQAQLDDAKIKLLNLRKTLADLEDEQQRAASIAKTAAGDAQAAEQKRIAALVARLPELRALHEQQRFAALEAAKQVEALDVKIAGLQAKLAAVPAGAGKEETAQRLDLETQIAAATELRAKALEHVVKAQEKADAVAAKSDLYTLETQALQAEIAGEEQLARTLRRRIALLREIASTGDPAAAEARLAAQNALADRERQRAADAVRLDGQLNALADERAAIESNRFLTEAEKHARIIPLLEEENRLIAERTALLAGDTSPDASRETRSLGERAAGNTADAAQAQPLSLSQELAAGAASAADQLGSSAHMAAQAWGQAADSIRTSMGSALADMIWQTGFTKEALKKFGMSMVENFVQIGAQMVADWIFKHTVMAAWSALFRTKEVAQTAATEASKTGLTTAGEVARTSVKATSEVAKTAIVTASETTQTEVSVANSATRTAANTTEGMGWLAKAAVQAMNAVASIPYVGPILAIAAAAAIIGAGIKLLTGGFRKGGYTGDGPADEVAGPVHRGEYVIPASQVAAIGLENIPSMLAGGLSSALPQNSGDAPASSSRSHGAAGNQPIAISVWDNRRSAGQWLRRQSGRRLLAQTLKRTAWERGVAT